MKFFEALNINSPESAALMTQEQHHRRFIPKSATDALPKVLLDYRSSASMSLSPKELEEACRKFKLQNLTPSLISSVERETRKQSGSRVWFRQRAGRITASKLKQAVRTDCEKPSKSLIKNICYPETYRFSTAATRYLITITLTVLVNVYIEYITFICQLIEYDNSPNWFYLIIFLAMVANMRHEQETSMKNY
jgi:hypothetical protein